MRARGDDHFEIVCVEIGQGDCTLIRCPGSSGEVVVIDCGRKDKGLGELVDEQGHSLDAGNDVGVFETKGFWHARDLLRTGGWKRFEALILTHPDQDHYNLVKALLEPASGEPPPTDPRTRNTTETGSKKRKNRRDEQVDAAKKARRARPEISARKVYFSFPAETESRKSVLAEYNVNQVGDFLENWEKWHDTIPAGDGAATPKIVAEGAVGDVRWSIRLLVSNFSAPSERGDGGRGVTISDETKKNERSVITLIQIGEKKALFCGDAERSTLGELLRLYPEDVKDVDLLLCPHHGSEANALKVFADTVKAKTVVVSAGFFEHRHLHPRWEALRDLEGRVGSSTRHSIDFWIEHRPGTSSRESEAEMRNRMRQALAADGRWGRFAEGWPQDVQGIKVRNNFAYLEEPTEHDFVIAMKRGGSGSRDQRWCLYRDETSKRIYTLASGSLVFRLGAGGLNGPSEPRRGR